MQDGRPKLSRSKVMLENEEYICGNLLLIFSKLKFLYRCKPGKASTTVFLEHNAEKVNEFGKKFE